MGKCHNCKLEVLDVTDQCPLCHSVLEQTEELEEMYPDVRHTMRRLLLVSRIYLFCSILASGVLLGVDVALGEGLSWSLVAILGLVYLYFVLRYAILGTASHKSKVVVLVFLAVLCAVGIDFATGYRGWSVDYVIPGGILLVDVGILIGMILNHRNWQSYMMAQILMVLLSIVPLGLYLAGLERNPVLVFLPMAVSAAILLGTVIIGGDRARNELKRRFHIN